MFFSALFIEIQSILVISIFFIFFISPIKYFILEVASKSTLKKKSQKYPLKIYSESAFSHKFNYMFLGLISLLLHNLYLFSRKSIS